MLIAFLRLGCLSFGGPIAHLGYFHAEFVERRRWCSPQDYSELVALAQSLPGPASSQVAFALGLLRAGWPGALAAWVGFTLPSALLIFAFACGHDLFSCTRAAAALHGLQLVAVAIVAQAALTMQRSLAPDLWRIAIAAFAAAIVFFVSSPFAVIATIACAAVSGLFTSRLAGHRDIESPAHTASVRPMPVSHRSAIASATVFAVLLIFVPALVRSSSSPTLRLGSAFYRTGALVFGGGHVVLPLLEQAVVAPGWVDQRSFLAGYGVAQALPGPLFTFAAYLGAVAKDPSTGAAPLSFTIRAAHSLVALAAIFLPGLLLMTAAIPFWTAFRHNPRLQSVLRTINASVVGILFAALLRPVATSAIHGWLDAAIATVAFLALVRIKAPPWTVVLATVLLSVASSAFR